MSKNGMCLRERIYRNFQNGFDMADIIEFSAYLFDKSKIKELSVHARRHLKTVLGADCSPFLISGKLESKL